ncbi:MAG: alcohol dehydrogenase catalytic domain-containing protein [Planctomycetaceae bacterium]|nr:alcohol dehydrogenase catalytic domain-containing protein [Planctomycetaceae bacterium]
MALPSLRPGQVLVNVRACGLCRTDLYAIEGRIRTWHRRFIPGHEFSGVVTEVGPKVSDIAEGMRVVVNPIIPCGLCPVCEADEAHLCPEFRQMGVDLNGAFCEQVIVSAEQLYPIPDSLSFEEAAFAEPIAAALGVMNAKIELDARGAVMGTSRIARLTWRVLKACGFSQVCLLDNRQAEQLEAPGFDFVVETDMSTEIFNQMVRLIRPGGRIVLKSRQYQSFEITLRQIIPFQPVIHVVNYGPFQSAVDLLTSMELEVSDLIGDRLSFDEFQSAIEHGQLDEQLKTFLIPGSL